MSGPVQADWQRVDALFARCLDIDPAGRQAFLDAACATQPELRARIEALLAASDAGEGLMHARSAILGDVMEPAAIDPSPLAPGTRLGPYTVQRLIGEGGMARVYLAEDARPDWHREVAIKLLEHAGPDVLARFQGERRILAGLEHPGIARFIDAGSTEGGQPWLVTEYVEGETISRYCRLHRPTLRQRLDLFLQLADAVQHAHGRLVVHRDLKPSNVLVDAGGRVRLLDFGIAKLLEGPDGDATTGPRTRTGCIPMTPEYAAPEQRAGGAVGTAVDIYQLGLLLFELLVDAPAWRATPSGGGQSLPKASTAVVRLAPATQPAALTEARRRARRVRGDLDAIIAHATAERAEARYATVQAMANDVRAHLRGERTSLRRDSLPRALWRFTKRNPLVAVAGSLLLVALVGWGASMQVYSNLLLAEREAAAREALRARQAKAFVLDLFRATDPVGGMGLGAQHPGAWDALPQAEADARRILADVPEVQADLFESIATLYRRAGRHDDAQRLLREALALQARTGQADVQALARTEAELASLLADAGESDEARGHLARALARVEPLADAHPTTAIAVWMDAGNALGQWGEHDARMAMMQRVFDLIDRTGHHAPSAEIEAHQQMASTHMALGNPRDGLAAIERGLDLAIATLGPDHGRLASLLDRQGNLLGALGRHEQAQAALRRALSIQLRWSHPDSPEVMTMRNNLAVVLGEAGRREEEQAELRVLREQRMRVLGADHLEVGRVEQNLGASLAKSGALGEAEMHLTAALGIFQARLPEGHAQRAFPWITLAQVRLDSGRPAHAIDALARADEGLGTALPAGHFAHRVVDCLQAEAHHQRTPSAATRAALRAAADGVRDDPAVPDSYRERCLHAEVAAAAPPASSAAWTRVDARPD